MLSISNQTSPDSSFRIISDSVTSVLRMVLFLTILFTIMALFSSCQEDQISPTADFETAVGSGMDWTSKNSIAKNVAINLASNIKSESLRGFIKENALNRFDGDNNFLIANHLSNEISLNFDNGDVRSFGSIVSGSSDAQRTTSHIVESILSEFPLLQVRVVVPENSSLETWNSGDIPLVAYIPSIEPLDFVPAYDSEGGYFELSPTVQPDRTVIVVSENERLLTLTSKEVDSIDCESFQNLEPYFRTENYSLYLKEHYYSALNNCALAELGDEDGTVAARITSSCTRDSNPAKDYLRQVKFANKESFNGAKDGWFDGWLELRCTIFFGRSSGQITKLTKYINEKEKDMKYTQWRKLDLEVVTWNEATYGDSMLYSWLEDDGGGSTTVSASFSSTFDGTTQNYNISYTVPSDHYHLGESIVEYCDWTTGDGVGYFTGRTIFSVNQQ